MALAAEHGCYESLSCAREHREPAACSLQPACSLVRGELRPTPHYQARTEVPAEAARVGFSLEEAREELEVGDLEQRGISHTAELAVVLCLELGKVHLPQARRGL